MRFSFINNAMQFVIKKPLLALLLIGCFCAPIQTIKAEVISHTKKNYNQTKPHNPALTENIKPHETISSKEASPEIIQETHTEKATANNSYVIGPGDIVKITVYGENNLSGNFKVGADGNASMPLIGVIPLIGLNLRQAETHIINAFKQGYLKNPSITVEIEQGRPFYILGEVKQPGSYSYSGEINIIEAIAMGGGFTYRANRKKVDIIRNNSDQKNPFRIQSQTNVYPGDIIFVKERFF